MHGGHHAEASRRAHQRRVIVRRGERAEPGLGEPDALPDEIGEIGLRQPRLEDHRARMDAHAARPIVEETGARRERQRLDAGGIRRPAGHVDLRGRDGRRRAAVQIAFEVADGALARRVIAEGDVHMAVDEAGDRGGAGGVHDHVAPGEIRVREAADRRDRSPVHQDAVGGNEGVGKVAADDRADVDDGAPHDIGSCRGPGRPWVSAGRPPVNWDRRWC